jgi:predicted GIY-YIG superfamily endonuclease
MTSRRTLANSPYPPPREIGIAYLVHLTERLGHAGHYSGFTEDLPARLAKHANGTGARLLQVAKERGIGWELARIWDGVTREQENRIKESSAAKKCPVCKGKPLSQAELTPRTTYGKQLITKGNTMTSTPLDPATEMDKGAATAERLIRAQMEAGFTPERIADIQAAIHHDYNPERANAVQAAFHEGYTTNAAALIRDYREMQDAEAEQRQAEHGDGQADAERIAEDRFAHGQPARDELEADLMRMVAAYAPDRGGAEADGPADFRANYEAGREPGDQIEADWQEHWGRQDTPGRWDAEPDHDDAELEAG